MANEFNNFNVRDFRSGNFNNHPQAMMNNSQVHQAYSSGYVESRRGYIPPPINDITLKQATFKFNMNLNAWTYEQFNNKGKATIIPIAQGMTLDNVFYIMECRELKWIVLTYPVNGDDVPDIIPAEAIYKGRIAKYVTHANKIIGCPDKLYNELLCFLIRTSSNVKTLTLFPHQGWNYLEGSGVYVQSPDETDPLFKLVSKSVLRRKLAKISCNAADIVAKWSELYLIHPALTFIGLLKIGSLLQYFFNSAGLFIHQLFIIEPSSNVGVDKLTAMLAPNNDPEYPLPTLDADKEVLLKEFSYIYDDVALCVDRTFADEEDKIADNIKDLLRAVIWDNKDEKSGRNLKVVISDNAAYTAVKTAPDNVVILNMDDVELNKTPEEIRFVTGQMESCLISVIENNFNTIKQSIELQTEKLSLLANEAKPETRNTVVLLLLVNNILKQIFEFRLLDKELFEKVMLLTGNEENHLISASQAILNDFSHILSDSIRSGSFIVLKKRKNMQIDSRHDAILDGDRIKIRNESLERILAVMTKTHRKEGLIKALKQTDSINTKDGNTHLLRTHDIHGRNLDLYLYDISAEILDSDVLSKLYNPEIMAYTLSTNERPPQGFMSLIRVENGISGQKVSFKDAENNHFYVTGQSGVGKTYMLSQLVAKRFSLGNRVLIFDNSDSFTYESLCMNLSKKFVDDNIIFYDIDREGIPVNLFLIDRDVSLSLQKKQLMGVLIAAMGELSSSQSNVLRTTLSQILSETDPNKQPRIEDIKSKLNGKGITYENIRDRLDSLLDDIKESKMSNNSWGDLIKNTNKIIVIRTNSLFTECGNYLIDILLATLFNYQQENSTTPLDVFIDEIQNQNFSEKSPICKIMREGRKIHMSLFGATQDYYPRNTELGSVMGKAGTEIFLRPTPNSESVAATELRFNKADMTRFDSMGRGDIIVKGSLYNKNQGRNVSVTLSGHIDDYSEINDSC